MLQFSEVLERWQWRPNSLIEVVISGQLIPCIYEKGALWPMRPANGGKRARVTPAIYFDQWMFLVGVKPTGPFDFAFEYLGKTAGCMQSGENVYTRDGTGYVNNLIGLT